MVDKKERERLKKKREKLREIAKKPIVSEQLHVCGIPKHIRRDFELLCIRNDTSMSKVVADFVIRVVKNDRKKRYSENKAQR